MPPLLASKDLFTLFVVSLATAATLAAFIYRRYQAAPNLTGHSLPPGPPARWFWQNALPSVNIAHALGDLATEYGPVVTLRQGSHIIIIIGSVDAAKDIMEKEGSALADRPRSIAAGELVSRGLRFLLPRAIRAYQDLQLEHAKDVILDVLNDPKNHRAHVQRYAASVILRLTYGKSTPTSVNDPEVLRIQQTMKNFQHAMRPGTFLVDRIPLLKYIPGYGRQLREYHDFELKLFRDLVNRTRSEMETNTGGDSFVRALLERTDEHQLSGDELAYLAGNLFNAGAETSAIGITNMILAAARYPDAQKRVQDELDSVVGNDRMPTWRDSESLPQVHAFVSETLRWRPVTPIGFAHRATQDVVWKGQCIPVGATVIGCHWAISRDPVAFPDPEKFDPQRWIDNQGRFRDNLGGSFPYGFGRRICPGQYLADNSLYINIVLLLWSFRIAEKPDKPIDVNAYTDAVVSNPAPFEVEFILRIEEGRLREMMSKAI